MAGLVIIHPALLSRPQHGRTTGRQDKRGKFAHPGAELRGLFPPLLVAGKQLRIFGQVRGTGSAGGENRPAAPGKGQDISLCQPLRLFLVTAGPGCQAAANLFLGSKQRFAGKPLHQAPGSLRHRGLQISGQAAGKILDPLLSCRLPDRRSIFANQPGGPPLCQQAQFEPQAAVRGKQRKVVQQKAGLHQPFQQRGPGQGKTGGSLAQTVPTGDDRKSGTGLDDQIPDGQSPGTGFFASAAEEALGKEILKNRGRDFGKRSAQQMELAAGE